MSTTGDRACTKQIAALIAIAVILCIPANTHADKGKHSAFNLAITTHLGDAQTFQEGDIVSFYVSLDNDAHLAIIYQDAGNHLYLLIPNAMYANNFFKAGLFIPIPNEQNPFQFRIAAPFGKETLWVFASNQPLPPLPLLKSEDNTIQLSGDIDSVRDLLKKHSRKNHALFEESSLILYTAKGSTPP